MLKSCYSNEYTEAGCDEVGRGCLAGPVVAAAVILPRDYHNKKLNDSKQLSKKKLLALKEEIIQDAVCYAIAEASHEEIDKINILKASFLAMHRALDKLSTRPDLLLIDGNRFIPYQKVLHHCIIKGDGLYSSIAAASVLAKTYRDELMAKLALEYPYYEWEKNVGYPTKSHRKGIELYGSCPLHRKSFKLLPVQLELFK